MDLACAEFVAEDLWLQSLKVTSTSNADSDSETAGDRVGVGVTCIASGQPCPTNPNQGVPA